MAHTETCKPGGIGTYNLGKKTALPTKLLVHGKP